jgi:hypothetical protein
MQCMKEPRGQCAHLVSASLIDGLQILADGSGTVSFPHWKSCRAAFLALIDSGTLETWGGTNAMKRLRQATSTRRCC